MQSGETSQKTLDSTQYSTPSILHYESVYGEDFVSPGGYAMAVELIGQLGLTPDSRVLDVGCGLGGSAFVMAQKFGLLVDGLDLSTNMLALATKKNVAHALTDRVVLEQGDCLELDRPEFYDGIYSRDVFLHISDKARLFSVLNRALRPGGKLLFTDYCCGERPWAEEFTAYVKDRGYCLHTLPEYAKLITEAGFIQVKQHDLTARFIEILRADLEKIANLDMSEPVRIGLEQGWRAKIARVGSGDHRWGMFTAVKMA